MYTCKFHISQDFICLIVIVYIVFGFRQTQLHGLINYSNYSGLVHATSRQRTCILISLAVRKMDSGLYLVVSIVNITFCQIIILHN